jgi:uncharacterized protein YcbK (DUF882 family)
MIHTVKKHCIVKASEHFAWYEFDCKCSRCTETIVAQELIDKLEALRKRLGYPVYLPSVYRCKAHQDDLRSQGFETAKGTSSHEMGLAADICILGMRGEETAPHAEAVGFQNIGIGKHFIHCDLRPGGPRRWVYTR